MVTQTKVESRTLIQHVLDWLREEWDIDLPALPQGVLESEGECPIAMALSIFYQGIDVGSDETLVYLASSYRIDRLVKHPPMIRRFITRFDEGKYPNLIVKEQE